MKTRRLALTSEHLSELGTDELSLVAGGSADCVTGYCTSIHARCPTLAGPGCLTGRTP